MKKKRKRSIGASKGEAQLAVYVGPHVFIDEAKEGAIRPTLGSGMVLGEHTLDR